MVRSHQMQDVILQASVEVDEIFDHGHEQDQDRRVPIWGLPRCERSSEEVQELGSCIRTPRGAHCYARAPRWAQAPSVRIQDPTAGLVPDTSYYGQQRSRPLRQTPVGRRWRGGPTTRCVGSRGLRIRGSPGSRGPEISSTSRNTCRTTSPTSRSGVQRSRSRVWGPD